MLEQMEWVKPEQIEQRSMEIIEQEMGPGDWTDGELAVVKRCIHTSADFDYAKNLYFSPDAVEKAISLLARGVTIVTDTNMAAAGINRSALEKLNCQVRCFMAEPDVAREAKERGVTRAVVSMERAAALEGEVIVAVGNAPTALIRICELAQEKHLSPAFVIGVPVGFVNVAESKEYLTRTGISCIAAMGRKGGSTIAAAVCNALLYETLKRKGLKRN